MELWPGVHLVGSGTNGFDLTNLFDCHVYLIDGGDEAALIDAGAGIDIEPLIEQIEAAVDPKKLSALLLTHKHVDHAGGAAALRDRYGLRVVASQHTADVVRKADAAGLSLDEAKRAGVYPKDFDFPPCEIDQVVAEGDEVQIGSVRLRIVETPGHCDGHLSFYGEIGGRIALFVADALFHGGRVVWQATYDCSVQGHIRSIQKLGQLEFDALLPGHLSVSLQRGKRHVRKALDRIERLELPKHLV